MNKSKKTPVPLPGSKPKPSSKATTTNASLSQEFVDSSDGSSDEQPSTTKKKVPVNIAIHKPKSNGAAKVVTKSLKNPMEKTKSSAKQSEKAKAATKASALAKKPALKRVTTEEEDATTSTGSEDTGEDAHTGLSTAPQRQAETTQDIVSGSASSSASDSASSSVSSSEESEDEAVPAATTSQSKPPRPQSHTVALQPTRPYVPPKNFLPFSTERASSAKSVAVFEGLEGKQVWHITAPEDLSLKELKEIAMGKALSGQAILSQKGTEYGFSTADNSERDVREVVIPSRKGYKAVSARISQTFHIRQVINLPNLSSKQAEQSTGSEAAASITRSTVRAPRPQVKGLKMRYFPSGNDNHAPITLGESDSEAETPAAQPTLGLAIRNGLKLSSKGEKRKHEDTNGTERLESPTKKHKKHRTPEEIKKREEKKAKKERRREKELKKGKS